MVDTNAAQNDRSEDDEGRARYRLMRELFLEVVELPPSERLDVLARLCPDDVELRREVEDLLDHTKTQFLDGPVGISEMIDGMLELEKFEVTIPERVGRFEVTGCIGHGGMGVVFSAIDPELKRAVAIKLLRYDLPDKSSQDRFRREAGILARIEHPGVVQIFEYGIDTTQGGRQPFLAMELIDGHNVMEFVLEEGLEMRERFGLLAKLCESVAAVHAAGVLHRDLKPGNVLVDGDGAPRLVDFGVARLLEDGPEHDHLTRTGQVFGSQAYMSPEQLRGAALDVRSDVYSLGVVAFEILTGRFPHDGLARGVDEVLRRSSELPMAASDVEEALAGDADRVLAKALDPDVALRYDTVADLGLEFERLANGDPVAARPPSLMLRFRRAYRPHRQVAQIALAALLALSIGLGVAIRSNSLLRKANDSRRLLSDSDLVDGLEARASRMEPRSTELLPRLDAWLAQSAALEQRAEWHKDHLAQLVVEGDPLPADSMTELKARRELVERLGGLFGADGAHGRMRRLREFCASIYPETVEKLAVEWKRTIAGIAASEHYGGLRIAVQPGLIPLGPDPDSGLFEFALYGAGEVPTRSGDEFIIPDEEMTVVFVLLSGGLQPIGSQVVDRHGVHYDPFSSDHEGPVIECDLAPFFMAKTELTRSQWEATGRRDPSTWWVGHSSQFSVVLPHSPVESVEHADAVGFAHSFECSIPTEAQWEYAARGGAHDTLWFWGNDAALLLVYERTREYSTMGDSDWLQELLPAHTPGQAARYVSVASYCPNPFGLYDMSGNLSEWCLDPYKVAYFDLPKRDWNCRVDAEAADGERSVRGGNAIIPPGVENFRISRRHGLPGKMRRIGVGFRLTRPVTGWRRSAE